MRIYSAPMEINRASSVNSPISCSGIKSATNVNIAEMAAVYRKIRPKIRSMVLLSPFPQYWADRIVAPPTRANKNKFSTNSMFAAKETAAIASPLTKPSIRESPALTADSRSCWKAIGTIRCKNSRRKSFFCLITGHLPLTDDLSSNIIIVHCYTVFQRISCRKL